MVVYEGDMLIGAVINVVIVEHLLNIVEAARLATGEGEADTITEAEIENRHAGLVGIGDCSFIPGFAEAVFSKEKGGRRMFLDIGNEFLPEP